MVTGMKQTAVVLATSPLLITLLEHYREGF